MATCAGPRSIHPFPRTAGEVLGERLTEPLRSSARAPLDPACARRARRPPASSGRPRSGPSSSAPADFTARSVSHLDSGFARHVDLAGLVAANPSITRHARPSRSATAEWAALPPTSVSIRSVSRASARPSGACPSLPGSTATRPPPRPRSADRRPNRRATPIGTRRSRPRHERPTPTAGSAGSSSHVPSSACSPTFSLY